MAIRSFRGTRRFVPAALLSLLTACYAPVLTPGAPCNDSAGCPDGQPCVLGACDGPIGGPKAPVDASPPPLDAAGEPPGDAALADSCHSNDRCINAATLGVVSGDTGHDTLAAKGSRAAWFRIRVTENDDSFAGVPLHVLARLTPPAGADFDVVLYVDPDSDVVECTNSFGTASASGNVKQVRASWGEDVVTDAENDSRDVSIEIRPKSTTCSDGAQWQLAIEGNWQ
jgi:hypothetical protein